MDVKTHKTLFLAVLVSLIVSFYVFLFLASPAWAAVLYSQTVKTSASGFTGAVRQSLGTGFTGTVKVITLNVERCNSVGECGEAPSSAGNYWVDVIESPNSNYADAGAVTYQNHGFLWSSVPVDRGDVSFDISDLVLNPSKYYFITFTGPQTQNVGGSSSSVWVGGSCDSQCGSLASGDIYFILDGDVLDTQTRTVWVYPSEGDITASKSIDFNVKYYLNSTTHDPDVYTKVLLQACPLGAFGTSSGLSNDCERYEIEDEILNQDTLVDVTVNFTVDKVGPYLGIVSFWNGVSENVNCKWWQVWCDVENILITAPSAVNFTVATTSISFDDLEIPGVTTSTVSLCNVSTGLWGPLDATANGVCKVLMFLFYPPNVAGTTEQMVNTLAVKAPFAFYFAPAQRLEELSQISSGSQPATIFVPFFNASISFINYGSIRADWGSQIDSFGVYVKYLAWIAFAFYIFKHLTKMDSPMENKQSPK